MMRSSCSLSVAYRPLLYDLRDRCRALGTRPDASPDELHTVLNEIPESYWSLPTRAVVRPVVVHPNLPVEAVHLILKSCPGAIEDLAENPTLPLLPLENPDMPTRIPVNSAFAALRKPTIGRALANLLRMHPNRLVAREASETVVVAGELPPGTDPRDTLNALLQRWAAEPCDPVCLAGRLELREQGIAPEWLVSSLPTPAADPASPEGRAALLAAVPPDVVTECLNQLEMAGRSFDWRQQAKGVLKDFLFVYPPGNSWTQQKDGAFDTLFSAVLAHPDCTEKVARLTHDVTNPIHMRLMRTRGFATIQRPHWRAAWINVVLRDLTEYDCLALAVVLGHLPALPSSPARSELMTSWFGIRAVLADRLPPRDSPAVRSGSTREQRFLLQMWNRLLRDPNRYVRAIAHARQEG
jgi:hypothetical protein